MGGWKTFLWVAVVGLALWFLYLVRGILLPFVLGFIIAIILEPLVKKLRLRGMSRGKAVALVFVTFFVVTIGAGLFAIPVVSSQVAGFSTGVSKLTRQFAAQSQEANFFVRWRPDLRAKRSTGQNPLDSQLARFRPTLERFGLPTTTSTISERYLEPRRKEITDVVQGFFNGFLGMITGVGSQIMMLPLTPFVALLLLMDLDRIRARAPEWVPPTIRKQTVSVVSAVSDVFLAYLRGMTLSWALYTTLLAIMLTILGAPYGVLLALLFGTLYLIPFIGGVINYITLFLIVGLSGISGNWFMQLPSPWAFALVLFGWQFVQTYAWDTYVHAKLVGNAVGLNPLVSMFVVFSGGALFGLLGMVIAFPIGGALKVILERLLRVTSTAGSDTLGLPVVPLRHRSEV